MTFACERCASCDARRQHALDGLRGLLALLVLAWHATSPFGWLLFAHIAKLAVAGFFLISGFVLTRSWDGRLGLFLARRFLRLWPVYGLCLAVGYAIAGVRPVWSQFFWYPIITADALPKIDPPIWSLGIEARAMPLMPLIVWAGSGPISRTAVSIFAVLCLVHFFVDLAFGQYLIAIGLMIFGSFLSRWDFRNAFLESAAPQFFGRISYSLYLTHWLVFAIAQRHFGLRGLVLSLPLAFVVGWLVWRFVETPSLLASRRLRMLAPVLPDAA